MSQEITEFGFTSLQWSLRGRRQHTGLPGRGHVDEGGDRARAPLVRWEVRVSATPGGISPGSTGRECGLEDG
jgi:hypothetical protein